VLIDQATFDSIRLLKLRELRLPVCRGRLGELKRCPLRAGSVRRLKLDLLCISCGPCREDAEHEATRARAVLRFIDDAPLFAKRVQRKRAIVITVHTVERQGQEWLVRFIKGEDRSLLDRPVFLAKYGDYTMTPSKQAVRGDPEVLSPFAKDLEEARRRALEKRVSPQQQALSRIRADTDTLLAAMTAMKDRNRLKLIRREIDKLAAKLSVEESAMLSASGCAESQWPVAVQDGPRPNGTEPLVSLEPAA
jgi:hypothetical protein